MKISQIGNDALQVLSGCRIDGLNVFLPPDRLDRKLYESVNKVLANLGGKWNKKAQAHVFSDDPSAGLDQCIRTGEVALFSKNGFFPTPAALADRMVEIADIHPEMTVLEPSCGNGSILSAITRKHGSSITVIGIEKNFELAAKCNAPDVRVGDFLETLFAEPFDRVLMNPPFELLQDCVHTCKAFDHLKPGGRLVGIMSIGATFRREPKAVTARELIDAFGSWEKLPDNSFKESGTGVNTIMVTLDKPLERCS